MNRLLALTVATVGFATLGAGSHSAPPDTRHFIYHNGNDTGSETFTRDGDSLSGEMAVGKTRVLYAGRVAADGTIPRLEIRTSYTGVQSPMAGRITILVGRDSTRLVEYTGRKTDTLRLATAPGTIPIINPSMGLAEVAVAHARSRKSRTVTIPILFIDALNLDVSPSAPLRSRAGPGTIDATFLSGDTVRFSSFVGRNSRDTRHADQLRVLFGPDGRIRGAVSGADAKDRFSARMTSNPRPRP
jgi:hypothetical protein